MNKQMRDQSVGKMLGIEALVKRHEKENSSTHYDPCAIYQPKKEDRAGHRYAANNIHQYSPTKATLHYSPTKNGKTANRITRKAFNRDKK